MIYIIHKRINRTIVFEGIIVILVLSILSAMMFPRFMKNQERTRIHLIENELKKMLVVLQQPGNLFYESLMQQYQNKPNDPYITHLYHIDSIAMYFPDHQLNLDFFEYHSLAIIYNGLDYVPANEDSIKSASAPFGVYVILNQTKSDNVTPYFNTVYIANKHHYLEPNPQSYYDISNGIKSLGMIYFDNQGRSWRDGK